MVMGDALEATSVWWWVSTYGISDFLFVFIASIV
jgi:hypothetical protein